MIEHLIKIFKRKKIYLHAIHKSGSFFCFDADLGDVSVDDAIAQVNEILETLTIAADEDKKTAILNYASWRIKYSDFSAYRVSETNKIGVDRYHG